MRQSIINKQYRSMNYLENELRNLVREGDEIFDFLQESSLDGLWYWDLTNPEEEWMNNTFWERLGYDPEKMPQKSSAWMDKIYPEDLKIAQKNLAEHLEHPEKPYDQIIRYIHAEGQTVWIRCRGMILRDDDGTPIRMLGAHTDVTALKKKEKILEQCNAAANIGYWEINVEKEQAAFSNMTKKILDLPSEKTPCLEGPLIFFKEGKERTRVEEAFETAKKDKTQQKTEALIVTKNGVEKWVSILMIPEFNAGVCTKIYGTLHDIDERVRSSMKIDELFKKTEKQNNRLMNFAHTITHNLRSQVGGVNSFIEIMEIDNPDLVNNEVFKYLKIASKRLSETVVHLSEIAVGDEFDEEDFVSLNLRSTAENCVESIVNFEELNDIDIEYHIPDDFRVDAIKGYLQSILHNLITNAIKYRDPEKAPYVKVHAGRKDDQSTWFAVEDNGLGLDLKEYKDKLFGLYTTFHKHEDSSGIGLFVTKNQVLAMNGDIDVESEPGIGSTFKVTLPMRNNVLAEKH